MAKRANTASIIFRTLARLYPDAHCSLHYKSPFQLLLAVVLSAQCTDAKVNRVLPKLFAAFPNAAALAAADPAAVKAIIRPLGLFRAKAKSLIGIAQATRGRVPRAMKNLVRLPGVGRKTANVVLSEAFGENEGIAVDTHCGRLARRLGLTLHEDPVRIERNLMLLFPRKDWGMVTHLFIAHGRKVCHARTPLCAECALSEICPSAKL